MNHATNGNVTCELCFDAYGPFELPWYHEEEGSMMQQQKRPRLGWLLTKEQYEMNRGTMDEEQYLHQTHGWEESIKVLDGLLDGGRYDCILGFSQGAAVAACTSARECSKSSAPRFKCCIILSGYTLPMMEEYKESKVGMPSMHIFGDPSKESQIPIPESQALADAFDESSRKILQTSHGHMVPSSRDDIARIGSFLLEHCCAN